MEYNAIGLTKKISLGGSTIAEYSYLADGARLSAVGSDGTGVRYLGSLIYSRASDGTLSLDCALTPGGRIVRTAGAGTYQVQHFLRDHLGSVRAVVDGATGGVLETNDYLPLGKRWDLTGGQASQTVTDPTNRWRFSGKESQAFFDQGIPYSDFGARLHDPRTGRWLAPDPLAEKYYGLSQFGYCAGDPVNLVDPDGLTTYNVGSSIYTIQDGYHETVQASRREYKSLKRTWNRGLGENYDLKRQKLLDSKGYLDSNGSPVLAASNISSSTSSSIGHELRSTTIGTAFLLDLSVLDLSDISHYKWLGYASIITIELTNYYLSKRDSEIAGLSNRPEGPNGYLYTLRAITDGFYPCVRGGSVFLNSGEVWKYGETTQTPPENRYGGNTNLGKMNLKMKIEASGTQRAMKIKEKYYIYDYFITNGELPPGNSIFR